MIDASRANLNVDVWAVGHVWPVRMGTTLARLRGPGFVTAVCRTREVRKASPPPALLQSVAVAAREARPLLPERPPTHVALLVLLNPQPALLRQQLLLPGFQLGLLRNLLPSPLPLLRNLLPSPLPLLRFPFPSPLRWQTCQPDLLLGFGRCFKKRLGAPWSPRIVLIN